MKMRDNSLLYPFNLQAGYAYNGDCVGHRCSLH
jgi:hypothetical protein